MQFKYATFWHEFRRLGSHVDDVHCHMYDADYIAMKYDTTGRQQPFKHRGMSARRLAVDDPLVIDRLNEYQYGAYVVFARNDTAANEERARRRKELFIVDLKHHELVDDVKNTRRKFFTADHFSFVVNDNDRNGTKLHFHRTEYLPQAFYQGQVSHVHAHLPLEFPLASVRDLHARLGRLALKARWVHAIMKRPSADADVTDGDANEQVGGGRRRRRRRGKTASVATFDDIFRNLPVEKLLVLAVPRPGDASISSVTIFVKRRAPHMSRGTNDIAFSFEMAQADAEDEGILKERIARAFERVERRDFDAPESTLVASTLV